MFDGTTFTEKDNSIIQRLRDEYRGGTAIFRFKQTKELTTNPDEFKPNVDAAFEQVKKWHSAFPDTPIDIFGYSRGAVAATRLAEKMKAEGIPVRFMGLVDPSTSGMYRISGVGGAQMSDAEFAGKIPDNVGHVLVAYAKARPGNLPNAPPKIIRDRIKNYQVEVADPKKTKFKTLEFDIEHWAAATDPKLRAEFRKYIELHVPQLVPSDRW